MEFQLYQHSTAYVKSYSVQFRPKDFLLVKHCWVAVAAAEGAGRLGGCNLYVCSTEWHNKLYKSAHFLS